MNPLEDEVQHGFYCTCSSLPGLKTGNGFPHVVRTHLVSPVFFRTALMVACEIGSSNIAEALIKKGADLTLVDSLGHNALHYSKLSENAGIQSLLLSKISQDAGM